MHPDWQHEYDKRRYYHLHRLCSYMKRRRKAMGREWLQLDDVIQEEWQQLKQAKHRYRQLRQKESKDYGTYY